MEFRLFFDFGDFFESADCFFDSYFSCHENYCAERHHVFTRFFSREDGLVIATFSNEACTDLLGEFVWKRCTCDN